MKQRLLRAVALALGIGAAGAVLHAWGVGLPLLLAVVTVFGLIAWTTPWIGVRLLDRAIGRVRAWLWRREQGRHHGFGGIALHVEDDGRHSWIGGADLQRVLRTRDPDDVLAARVPGRWRRDGQGQLLLRVDAVVEYLAGAPGRMDPRMLRLRQYLEREVLFPAAKRRGDLRRGRPR